MAFACPPDCGHCCTHLERKEAPGDGEFREVLRAHGVYHCSDGARTGLSLTSAEAAALRGEAIARGLRVDIHPRTFLLETRRRATVVLDWHLAAGSCPFYESYQCVVYAARPLVCRAYPVLGLGKGALAPECPKMPVPGTALRAERAARRAIEAAHARLDELGWLLLETPGTRFAKGLSAREATARVKRYRVVAAEAFAAPQP